MENYNPTATNPETLRQVLAAQDENIHHLRNLISNITEENLADHQKTLTEKLCQLEDLEQRMWATLFPSNPGENPTSHRMTMAYNANVEQYY